MDYGSRRDPGPFRAGRERAPRGRRRPPDRAEGILRARRRARGTTGLETPPGLTAPGLAGPGLAAPAGPVTPSGYAGQTGYGATGEQRAPRRGWLSRETGFPGEPGFPGDTELPGDSGRPGQTDPSLRAARPGGRLAARQQEKSLRGQARQEQGRPQGFPEAPAPDTGGTGPRGRGRRPAAASPANDASRQPGSDVAHAAGHDGGRHRPDHRGLPGLPPGPVRLRRRRRRRAVRITASSNASPTLGPWKHITTRADDPKALSLTELFPANYAASGTVTRTVQRAGDNRPALVLGNKLKSLYARPAAPR